MSDNAHIPDHPTRCEDFDEAIAEFALEIIDLRDRETLLAHSATCQRCSTELSQLSWATDRLPLLAPECVPRVVFQQRVMESLSTNRVRRLRPVRPIDMSHLAAAP